MYYLHRNVNWYILSKRYTHLACSSDTHTIVCDGCNYHHCITTRLLASLLSYSSYFVSPFSFAPLHFSFLPS